MPTGNPDQKTFFFASVTASDLLKDKALFPTFSWHELVGGRTGRDDDLANADAYASFRAPGLAAVAPGPSRRRRRRRSCSPPPGSLEAPRLPEREVEPSPRRPRRRESSATAAEAGAGLGSQQGASGESVPSRASQERCAARGRQWRQQIPIAPRASLAPAQPATSGWLVQLRRTVPRLASLRRCQPGAQGTGGGREAVRQAKGAAPPGGRAGTRRGIPGRVRGCCDAGVVLASSAFLVAFRCLITFCKTH
ncbi:hypothetical protein H8959_004163 [Pygathrix nigripes]